MRDFYNLKALYSTLLISIIFMGTAPAQPSADRLADDILQKYSERLSHIETISITLQPSEAGFIPEVTTHYEKRTENGRTFLVPVDTDSDLEYAGLTGLFDEKLAQLVRGSRSITGENLDTVTVYKVFVDDIDLIRSLDENESGFNEMESETETVTVWIDSEELYVRKVLFDQAVRGEGGMSVEMVMDDYRLYSGFPIAHTVKLTIHGLSSQFSEEDMAEAKETMRQMEEQLSQMPEPQRKAIERQIKPQMEQFEKMLNEGEPAEMKMNVVDVRVNE